MVTRDLKRSFGGFADGISATDLKFIVPAAVLGGLGLVGAQRVSDMVLPRIIGTADPSSPTEVGLSAVVKAVAALLAVVIGSAVGGVGVLLGGAFGGAALTLAGADVIGLVESLLRDATGGGSGGSAPARRGMRRSPRRTAQSVNRRSPSARSSGQSSPSRVPAAGGDRGAYNY